VASGGAPSLGTLEYMLRKSLDTDISFHEGPFPSEGNLVCGGGGLVYWGLPQMKEGSSGGASLCVGFHQGDLEERAPLLGNPKDEVFERDAKCPINGPPSPWGPCFGTWRGFVCWDFSEKRKVYLGSFLGPGGH